MDRIIRLVKMGGQWYSIDVDLEDDIENIKTFVDEYNPVLLVADMELAQTIIGDAEVTDIC